MCVWVCLSVCLPVCVCVCVCRCVCCLLFLKHLFAAFFNTVTLLFISLLDSRVLFSVLTEGGNGGIIGGWLVFVFPPHLCGIQNGSSLSYFPSKFVLLLGNCLSVCQPVSGKRQFCWQIALFFFFFWLLFFILKYMPSYFICYVFWVFSSDWFVFVGLPAGLPFCVSRSLSPHEWLDSWLLGCWSYV